jgi:O-antigen ligase
VRDAQNRLMPEPVEAAPLPAAAARPVPSADPIGAERGPLRTRIIEYGILGLLILSPLPAASVDDWAILAIELTAALLAAVYALTVQRPRLNPRMTSRLIWPRRTLAVFLGLLVLQIIPLPKGLVALLSPGAAALRARFSAGFGGSAQATLSLVPTHTLRAALEILAYALIGFLVVRTVTHRRQIERFLIVLAAAGTFQAFYGLFELFHKNPRVLFFAKVYNLNSATGTFVNRNHFSGYLEMIIPLALGLLIARVDLLSLAGKSWPDKIAQIAGRGFTFNVLILISVVVMSLAIVRSNSRSGVFILLFIFVLFFELTVFHFSAQRYRQEWIKNFLKAVFVLVTIGALYTGIEATMGRFAKDNLLQEGRPQYWASAAAIFGDYPVWGTGLGTFGDIYPAYGTIPLEGRLTHAHNDYLEYLSDLGLLGFAALLATIAFLVGDGFLTWSKRRHPQIKGLGMGGFVAVAAMLVHSFTDFNLHIPANMLLFSVVLGLMYATAYYRKV